MRWFTSLVVLAVLLGFCNTQELYLALEDNFDDFNLSLWKHELTLGGGGNNEFQWYTNNRTNSYVENGVLHIRPTLTANDIGEDTVRTKRVEIWGHQPPNLCTGNAFFGCERDAQFGFYNNPVRSARIRTAESFSFTYGKVEVRAKQPRGDWLWPAIWMLPTDYQYGEWPASGEIDIMEGRGNPPSYPPGGYDSYSSALHWGMNYRENRFPLTVQKVTEEQKQDLSADFHTYGLIWNETYIGTYLDSEDNPVLQVPITQPFFEWGGWNASVWTNPWKGRGNNAPFDRRFFLVMNLAVGGTGGYFPDLANVSKPWFNNQGRAVNDFYDNISTWYHTWTQPFQIDSVRVWTYQSSAVWTSSTFGLIVLSVLLSV